MTIPFLDLRRLHDSIRGELDEAVAEVIDNSRFVGANASAEFEADFARAHDSAGAVGCGSGTDALHLALRALGVGEGDEVIVPAMTFVATAEAVIHAGATPVVADVDPSTLLLDEVSVAAARSDRTRAVIPVHLYGHVVPFDRLRAWRDEGLIVVEDAAQAHLASWRGAFVGTVGHAACFSFYPGKNLGALGDGGAVLSRDVGVLEEVRRLRDHGRHDKYRHDAIGFCSRLDGIQAAVLSVKLRHLPEWTDLRRQIAGWYRHLVGDLLVPWEEGAVHHLLVAQVPERDRAMRRLDAAGVGTGIHYPLALSHQPALAPARSAPSAESAAGRVLSLPMDPLMGKEQVEQVADLISRELGL